MPPNNTEEKIMLHKRRSDDHQTKIDDLIEAEQDHKTRLTLMIMSNLNKNIIANTELIQSMQEDMVTLQKDMKTQATEQEAARHQGMGMYKVMKVVTPALWFITCAIVSIMYDSYNKFQNKTLDSLSVMEVHIQQIETALLVNKVIPAPVQK